ncbi:hypothetical protein HNQ03_003258 [Chryseobacterium sp. 16F]|uniref:Uncharacterized protein n=1 Tax=Frigoriflavimonas asaccharolytica TaxID=2735899 RepID=A0A8J8GA23_9FLAO|nr:hypothetical protein [Frigoriflavimonas asaccharolytica]
MGIKFFIKVMLRNNFENIQTQQDQLFLTKLPSKQVNFNDKEDCFFDREVR